MKVEKFLKLFSSPGHCEEKLVTCRKLKLMLELFRLYLFLLYLFLYCEAQHLHHDLNRQVLFPSMVLLMKNYHSKYHANFFSEEGEMWYAPNMPLVSYS